MKTHAVPSSAATLPRLYAVLDIDRVVSLRLRPLDVVDAWLEAGVTLLQLRAKSMSGGPMFELASAIALRAAAAGATFIVNDRADVARWASAAGVHLGQGDVTPLDARLVLGEAAWVGLSTHNEVQVRRAVSEPISYLAIGPVFATTSKLRADPVVGLSGVRGARAHAAPHALPVVAIGGITIERAAAVIEAGAHAVAAIADLLAADPGARARAYLSALR